MRKINTLLTICAAASMLHAQPSINPDDYRIDAADVQRAEKLIAAPVPDDVVMPTRHPDAQWYPGAALGLFMHWGIHSVDGIQPSWNMIKHYRYGGKRYHSPKRYYRLARKFKPTILPDSFLTAARDAGFTYAVLTTRHHDGYALWPSKYGIGVRTTCPAATSCASMSMRVVPPDSRWAFTFRPATGIIPRQWRHVSLMSEPEARCQP